MGKFYWSFLILLSTQFFHAQSFKDYLYYEGEVGGITSFLTKDADGNTTFIAVGGLSFRGGLGFHDDDDNFFLGLHSGIEGNFRHNTGILPVYINSKIALEVGDKGRLIFSFGYGKSFQIGTENYKGFLRKYTIALGNMTQKDNMQSVFLEINNHGFSFPDGTSAVTLNLGFTYTFL